jgi:hypothetical protein
MVCAGCKRHTERGNNHFFFYGNKGAADIARLDALTKKFRTSYHIIGGKEAFICSRCATKGFLSTWQGLLTIAATLYFIYLIFTEIGPITWESVGIMALIYLVLVGSSWLAFRANRGPFAFEAFGDLAAISAYREELEKEGHDAFITRADATRFRLVIPQDVGIMVKGTKAEPVPLKKGVCWYCGTRPPLGEAALIYKMKKEDKEKKIKVPRCEYCMKIHNKVGVRIVVILVLLFFLGTAACLVSGLVHNNWWIGIGLSLVLLVVAGVLVPLLGSRTHKKAGTRNQGTALNQLPEITKLINTGWRHLQTITKTQDKK